MIYFFILAISFIIVFLSTPTIRYLALRLNIVDRKNHRKIHKKVVTKLGGLGIYLGFLGGLVIVAIIDPAFMQLHAIQLKSLLFCSSLIMILGIYDDFQGSNALIKFFVQAVIAFLLIKSGFVLKRIYIPGLEYVDLNGLGVAVTMLWFLGITNAINLLDGLDGLAAGTVLIASLFFCAYGIIFQEAAVVMISLALIGANLAFLRYNFYPAKIFMGDTGSLFLGFIIASLGIYSNNLTASGNIFFLPAIILLLLPISDTTLAVVRRVTRRENPFRGDSSHIHHYFIKRGFKQPQAVIRLYLVTFCFGMLSLLFIYGCWFFK